MTSCTGVKTISKGLENEAYIEIIGKPSNYSGGVDVTIDENTSFNAQVNKGISKRPKGKVYAIPTGKHTITVKHNKKVIYSKQIFVSSQETKQIILP
jgi:hypothetical protein